MPIEKRDLLWCEKPGVCSPDQPPTKPSKSSPPAPPIVPEKMNDRLPSDMSPGKYNWDDPRLMCLPPEQIHSQWFLSRPAGPIAFVIHSSSYTDGTGKPDAKRPGLAPTAPKIGAAGKQGVTCKVLNQGFKLYPVHLAPRYVPSPGVEGTKKVVPVIQDGDQAVPRQEPSGTEHTVPVAPPDGNVPGLRTVCVSSYVTPAENLQLKAAAKRLHQRKGELLRRAYFESTVTIIVPEANEEKWQDLARVCANLNQIASKLNLKDKNVDEGDGDVRPILRELGEKVHHLRADLRGNSVNKSVKT